MGIEQGLLVRVHGNLILPIKTMVTQLGYPFIKQLLRLNLQSRYRNQKISTRASKMEEVCQWKNTHTGME